MDLKRSLVAFLVLIAIPAEAIELKNAAYYCTTDASGGVSYDEPSQKWKPARFKPSKAFVLKLTYLSNAREKMFEGAEVSKVARFNVAVTEAGSSKNVPCYNITDYKKPVDVWDAGWLRCNSNLTEIRFNPENNRFMAVYLVGYVNGADNNEDTPSISIGLCTPVN